MTRNFFKLSTNRDYANNGKLSSDKTYVVRLFASYQSLISNDDVGRIFS